VKQEVPGDCVKAIRTRLGYVTVVGSDLIAAWPVLIRRE
jgi:hypothetical protein